jgi:hypothetical protein
MKLLADRTDAGFLPQRVVCVDRFRPVATFVHPAHGQVDIWIDGSCWVLAQLVIVGRGPPKSAPQQ